LNGVDAASTNSISVIYQNGYITIKDYDKRFGVYRLGFPNKDMEEGFMCDLLSEINVKFFNRGEFLS